MDKIGRGYRTGKMEPIRGDKGDAVNVNYRYRDIDTVIVDPMGKPRMTQRDKWAKRPVVQRYFDYKDKLQALKSYAECEALAIHFLIPMPKSWSKKKRAQMLHKPHKQKPDIDNLVKGVLDAIMGDDSHVHTIVATKGWAETGRIDIAEII